MSKPALQLFVTNTVILQKELIRQRGQRHLGFEDSRRHHFEPARVAFVFALFASSEPKAARAQHWKGTAGLARRSSLCMATLAICVDHVFRNDHLTVERAYDLHVTGNDTLPDGPLQREAIDDDVLDFIAEPFPKDLLDASLVGAAAGYQEDVANSTHKLSSDALKAIPLITEMLGVLLSEVSPLPTDRRRL